MIWFGLILFTTLAAAFGRPQYHLVSTNGLVPYYYQPHPYLYSAMAHQPYWSYNPYNVPFAYQMQFATPTVMHQPKVQPKVEARVEPKVQPYFIFNHCHKLQEQMLKMFELADSNSDGKVSLEELEEANGLAGAGGGVKTVTLLNKVFTEVKNLNFSSEDSAGLFTDPAFKKYGKDLPKQLFIRNDGNNDNNLNVFEFAKYVGDYLDVFLFFVTTDLNRNLYVEKEEYEGVNGLGFKNYPTFAQAEAAVGSSDQKLSVDEFLTIFALEDIRSGSQKFDLCARGIQY